MGLYNRGRPKKIRHEDINSAPDKPGEYRIRDHKNEKAYIGETNNLRRRLKEHKKSGKLKPDYSVEYMVANESSSMDRRDHEQRSIRKHNPYLNKSKGGEGRPAKYTGAMQPTVEKTPSSIGKALRKAIKIALIVIAVYALYKIIGITELLKWLSGLIDKLKSIIPLS